jgi:hypothetical protein
MEKADKNQMTNSINQDKEKLKKIYDYYYESLKDKENMIFQMENHEDKLLISNGLVDQSIILSQKFSLYKLKFLFEEIVFRNYFIGVGKNSKAHEIVNCFLKKDLLLKTEKLILIVQLTDYQDYEEESLYKCRIQLNKGIKFLSEESDLICRGIENIKEKIIEFEKDILLEEILNEDEYTFYNNKNKYFSETNENEEILLSKENSNFQKFTLLDHDSDNDDSKEILKYLEKVCYILKIKKSDFNLISHESEIAQNGALTEKEEKENFLNTEFICLPNLIIENYQRTTNENIEIMLNLNVTSESDQISNEINSNLINNHTPTALVDCPKYKRFNSLKILKFLINSDELEINSYLAKYHDQLKNKIKAISLKSNSSLEYNFNNLPENIISSTLEGSLEIEDIYFLKFIKDRKYKYNTIFTSVNLEEYSDSKVKESFSGFNFIFSKSNYNNSGNTNDCEILSLIKMFKEVFSSFSILQSYLLINNSESIFNNQEFLNKISKENLDIRTILPKEEREITLCELIKDKKLSMSEKEDLYKNLISKIIIKNFSLGSAENLGNFRNNFFNNGKQNNFNNLSSNFNISFISSSLGLLGILNKFENNSYILDLYFQSLYKKIENNIYRTFEVFQKDKLNFLIKKSNKPAEEILSLAKEIFSNIFSSHFKNDINHYYSSHRRYSTIINDLLNIPIESPISICNKFPNNNIVKSSSNSISSSVELEASIILYKGIIEGEFEKFSGELIEFYSKFANEFEEFYNEKRNEINLWSKKIMIHTSGKLNCLTKKYNCLFYEMKNKLDIYYNEIIEKDMLLILSIKEKLKASGYINEYMSRYLNNIQYMMKNNLNFEEDLNFGINGFLFSSGIGFASGLITFGIGRVVTILSADALTGTALGPIGTLAGATIGAVSIIGSSVYHMYKSKSKLKDKFMEYEGKAKELKELIYDRMEEFRIFNKSEIESRINKIMSYVELSIRKSSKIESG